MELYCLKCKSKNTVKNIVNKTAKNGRVMVCGNCDKCNTKCNQFVKKSSNDVATPTPKKETIKEDVIKEDVIKEDVKKVVKIKKPRKGKKDIIDLLNPPKAQEVY